MTDFTITDEQLSQAIGGETKDWEQKGIVPGMEADLRRHWARVYPSVSHLHNAVADAWERIMFDPNNRGAICRVIRAELNKEIGFMADLKPGTELHKHHENNARKWDVTLAQLDPNHER